MLKLSTHQIAQLGLASRVKFCKRVDDLLTEQVAAAWSSRPVEERMDQLLALCARGLDLGIVQEVYLSQFMLLNVLAGDAFLQRADAQVIATDERMTWRERLYQLIALAGFDMADGAPAGV